MATINILTASAEELRSLPGIGQARAKSIISERKKNQWLNIQKASGVTNMPIQTWQDWVDSGRVSFAVDLTGENGTGSSAGISGTRDSPKDMGIAQDLTQLSTDDLLVVIDDLGRELDDKEEEIRSLRKRLANVREALLLKKRECEDLGQQNGNLQEDLNFAREERGEIKKQLENARGDLRETVQATDLMRVENRRLQEGNSSLEQQVADLRAQCSKGDTRSHSVNFSVDRDLSPLVQAGNGDQGRAIEQGTSQNSQRGTTTNGPNHVYPSDSVYRPGRSVRRNDRRDRTSYRHRERSKTPMGNGNQRVVPRYSDQERDHSCHSPSDEPRQEPDPNRTKGKKQPRRMRDSSSVSSLSSSSESEKRHLDTARFRKEKKQSKRDNSSSSFSTESGGTCTDDTSSCDSESESEGNGGDRRSRERHHYRRKCKAGRKRSRSPQPPKLPVFSGEKTEHWDGFILQFERTAKSGGWSKKKKMKRLHQCLAGQASFYANRSDCTSYRKLVKEMQERFGKREDPSIAKRMLRNIAQFENETLEEFGQRVWFLALDAYRHDKGHSVDQDALEHFLQGIRDKQAAIRVINMRPKSLKKAIKYVRETQANFAAIFGKKRDKAFQIQRQVTWRDQVVDSEVRIIQPEANDSDVELIQLKARLGELERCLKKNSGQDSKKRLQSPSASPSRLNGDQCFKCGTKGHFARDCPSTSRDRSPFSSGRSSDLANIANQGLGSSSTV